MIVTCRNNGFPDPDFNETVQPETIVVTIPLTIDSSIATSMEDRIAGLISEDNKITAMEISQGLGVPRSTVTGEISMMTRKDVLERFGGPRGRWSINRR